MAERDKNEHTSESIMERFCMRGLTENELTTVARHLTGCPDCQAKFVSTLRRQRDVGDLSFTLASELWLRHEHLDYDQLVELGDDTLEGAERELIDAHLKVCPPCREDVRSFLAFKDQIAPEMEVSYTPVEKDSAPERRFVISWWRSLTWKPVYSAALVVIGIALVIGAALLLNRRQENQQVQHSPTPHESPGSTPDDRAANLPSPNGSPSEEPDDAEAVAVLNDGGKTITVYKGGRITGLEEASETTRNYIAQALLASRLDRPSILKELSAQDSALRGRSRSQPFKLISPSRSVIVSNRPTFKWESMSGASAYTLYITDTTGQIVAKSDQLAADRREWRVPNPLKRGEVYSWTVTAVVDGKEITSPGASAPEMKFHVLSAGRLQQLDELRKGHSRLALGVFYAHEGMTAEAEHEFRILVRDNPRSQHANKLLRDVQSWRRR